MGAVKVLLENDKSSAYIADSSGLFPVHVASSMGYLELVIQLFEFCPDSDELLDGRGKNFLHIAVDKRKVRVVRWVCDNSKVVRAMNAKDDEGNTPMHIAVKAKDIQILAHLIKSKKVYIGVMNKIGLTPLDLARAQFTIGLGSWQVVCIILSNLFAILLKKKFLCSLITRLLVIINYKIFFSFFFAYCFVTLTLFNLP